jgi:hypothetical protein
VREVYIGLVVLLAASSLSRLALAKKEAAPYDRTDGVTAGTVELRVDTLGATFFPTQSNPAMGVVAGDPATTFLMGMGAGVGYFLTRNFELGGEADLAVNAQSSRSEFGLGLGPFARFVTSLSAAIALWGEGRLGFVYDHTSATQGNTTNTNSEGEFRLGASCGLDFNIRKDWALFAGVGVDLYMGSTLVVPIGLTYGLRGYL